MNIYFSYWVFHGVRRPTTPCSLCWQASQACAGPARGRVQAGLGQALVPWQLVVGEPSTGKPAALAPNIVSANPRGVLPSGGENAVTGMKIG